MIAEIERAPGVTWTPGAVERFAMEPPGASKRLCGVKGNMTKSIESAVKRGEIERFVAEIDGDIPEAFDSAEQWPDCAKIINDIRDQSNCGCCWAFAGAEAASDRMCIATKGKTMIPISAQDVCFNANPDGCDGGQIDTPWQYIKDTGAVSGGQYQGTGPFGPGLCSDFSLPHCHHHGPQGKDPYPAEGKPGCPSEDSPAGPTQCDAAAKAPHNNFKEDKYYYKGKTQTASGEKAIQQMIMTGGPVETAFTVYSDFELYTHGVYHHVTGEMAGGHAVRMVGWGVDSGVKYWKVANSWNPYWAEKGFFRIRRGTNEGGIEDQVVGASSDAARTALRVEFLSIRINRQTTLRTRYSKNKRAPQCLLEAQWARGMASEIVV
ncbi:CTSB [Symbiodinium natans]|uniref:CTSB protein n=1 Tax=Symbiodinium natans TaxID=878477 RepID=A0A812I896_9DINO|nr:CTSB [Symbiodinium natans]